MRCTLRGGQLVDAVTDLSPGDLTIDGTRIQFVGVGQLAEAARDAAGDTPGTVIDATDMILMPGFIDVHTHGGGGYNLQTTDPQEIQAYARWAATTGVTSFLIAVVGVPDGLPEAQLHAAVTAIDEAQEGARPLGIYLEGPYISPARRGAHPTAWLRAPSDTELARILSLTNGRLRIVTLAPELPGAATMIRRLVDAGVTVSMGHTDATYEQALEAIALGVTHATHCCNAMRPLHHRDPGPLGALAQAPQVYGEVIADGVHVHPAMLDILVKAFGPDRTIVITDALAGAGYGDLSFDFGGQAAQVIHGVARLADGTITGSVLTMEQALRNILDMTGVSLPEAVGMLTRNPAHAAGVADHKGLLRPGYDADLVVMDSALTLQATYCCGQLAYATETWRERIGVGVAQLAEE